MARGYRKQEGTKDEIPLGTAFDKSKKSQEEKPDQSVKDEGKVPEEIKDKTSDSKVEEEKRTEVEDEIPNIPNISAGKVEEERKKQDNHKPPKKKNLTEKERLEFAAANENGFNAALVQYSVLVLKQSEGKPSRFLDASKVMVPYKVDGANVQFSSIGFAMAYYTADVGGTIAHRIQVWIDEHRELVGVILVFSYGAWFHYKLIEVNKAIVEQERREAKEQMEKDKLVANG